MKLPIFSTKRASSKLDDAYPSDVEFFKPQETSEPAKQAVDVIEDFEKSPAESALTNTPNASGETPSQHHTLGLSEMRTYILDRLLILASGLGLIIYVANLSLNIRNRQWGVIILGLMVVLALLGAAAARRISNRVRSAVLLSGLLIAGVATLAADGLNGGGRLFLLVLPILAVVFTGRRESIFWLVIALVSLGLTGLAITRGWIPVPTADAGLGNNNLSSWISSWGDFFLLAVAGAASLSLVLQGLETSLRHEQSMAVELESERGRLELRVEARTQDLERRLTQIRTAAEVARVISRELDINHLLAQVCELARDRFNLYYVGVFLIEHITTEEVAGSYAVLRAGTGDAGQQMLNAGHKLMVGGDSMIGWATYNKKPRIALDVGAEAVRFNNPYLPRTRSELALPILTGDSSSEARVLGAMTVQSAQEAAFDQDDITALQAIADSLASAIENARLFSAMQTSLDEINALHRQYLEGAWGRATSAGPIVYARTKETGPESASQSQQYALPIRLRDQIIGSITLEPDSGKSLRDWSQEDYALIDAVIDQAALALENARLLEETQRAAENERVASRITTRLWSTSDIDSILRIALDELGTSLNAHDAIIELRPETGADDRNISGLDPSTVASSIEGRTGNVGN